MLRRIKQIKGVGTFVSFEGGAHQFEQLTFIFGENGYGKSTICDILSSLSENNPDYISGRESIHPFCIGGQSVKLNIDTLEVKGNDIIFQNRAWHQTLPGNLKLLIFDTGFIHRNVFTGLGIERENKKNITDFILGEENVQSAEKVEKLKQESRKISIQISHYEKGSFKNISNIDEFIKLNVIETKKELDISLEDIIVKGREKRTISNSIEKIQKRGTPQKISINKEFQKSLEIGNQVFELNLENIHKSAEEQINNHVLKKMKEEKGEKTWLQAGMKFRKDEFCPFCGQVLLDDAKNLIKAYQNGFDENYRKFILNIQERINETKAFLNNSKIMGASIILENNFLLIESYKEIESHQFIEIKKRLELFQAINTSIDHFNSLLDMAAEAYKEKSNQKNVNPLEPIPTLDFKELINSYSKLDKDIESYNRAIDSAIVMINAFKAGLSSENINKEISLLENKYKSLKLKKVRLEKYDDCNNYTALKTEKTNIEENLKIAYEQLENSQNKYLKNYFDNINDYFQKFGSNDFEITKKINKSGNKPVISIGVKFKGKAITDNRIKCVFGESDRRALALAIFWTKVMGQNDEEKKRSIVVLDDPVTSFDDGRIERTIREMDKSISSLRQIIVLTHYASYLKRFYDREYSSLKTTIVKLSKENEGVKFIPADPSDFIENEHQLKYRRIVEFIERKHSEDVLNELRVYLEHELKSRFRYQIEKHTLNTFKFSDLINGLYENHCISDATHDSLDCLRKSLNTPHHTWCGYSHEEKVSIANDVINCIYLELQPVIK